MSVLGELSGWEIFWVVVLAVIVLAVLFNLRDILRYLRIRSM
jgi:hypothetical protein